MTASPDLDGLEQRLYADAADIDVGNAQESWHGTSNLSRDAYDAIRSLRAAVESLEEQQNARRDSLAQEIRDVLRSRDLWTPPRESDLISAVAKAIDKIRTELAAARQEPRCDSCGAKLTDPDACHCFGCEKTVCYVCVEAFGHQTGGAHGSGDPAEHVSNLVAAREELARVEFELAAAREDTARLEWLQRLVLSCVGDPISEVCLTREPFEEAMEPYVGYQIRVRGDAVGDFGRTLRAALDAARASATTTEDDGE